MMCQAQNTAKNQLSCSKCEAGCAVKAEQIQPDHRQNGADPDLHSGFAAEKQKIKDGGEHRINTGDKARLSGICGHTGAVLLQKGSEKQHAPTANRRQNGFYDLFAVGMIPFKQQTNRNQHQCSQEKARGVEGGGIHIPGADDLRHKGNSPKAGSRQ